MVEIAAALARDCQLLILDEPTSALSAVEVERLFGWLSELREQGVGIVYISHKMDEIFDITDRVTVLRDGQVQGTLETKDTDLNQVTRMMIGRTLDTYFVKAKEEFGAEVLRVDGLSKSGQFSDVSFSVREGEVLGLYGLVGAGRSEVVETIFGVRRADAGQTGRCGSGRGPPTRAGPR